MNAKKGQLKAYLILFLHLPLEDLIYKLRTFLQVAMSIGNSRPLTINSRYDPKSAEPLTLNRFITMMTSTPHPLAGKFFSEDI